MAGTPARKSFFSFSASRLASSRSRHVLLHPRQTRPSVRQRDLVAHQDADLVHLLPFVFQAEQGADLEVAGGDVDGLGELAPIVEVAAGPSSPSSLLSTMKSSLPVLLVRLGMMVSAGYLDSAMHLLREPLEPDPILPPDESLPNHVCASFA